ncbi:hypothetical protein NQ315_002274 [Exocentrus adspersus]|uniref:Uncharacterized protein n=1 Tax=Exocentrus adspersus TaxID=1586481 RepID=A0AAV8VTE7_9CUCU|nr:hypothetical protein NQ315_002274 [Exocentrus adspersus]
MKPRAVYLMLVLSLFDFLDAYLSYTCPNLVLKNGKVKRRQRGRFVKFVCNTGYLLAGERFSTCVSKTWDPAPPKCVRPTCMNKASPPTNGLIYPTHSGAALHIYCKAGYQIKGPTDIYCDGRRWDNNMPACLPTNTKPRLFCDFEDAEICGWSHDLNHDFDWRRENYNTPSGSIGTGPSFDHTKGPGQDGYYMYIESSSRNENDVARLISPIFDGTSTDTCLEFYYHMYGAMTGTLRVYLKKASEDWYLDPKRAVFTKSGNQGNQWFRSYHYLGIIDEEYQIVIEGVRGPGYVSDIAVDDVKVIEDCVYEEATTTTETYSLSTDLALTVESCESRCGLKASGNETHMITCDCDESCYDNNRCCPDYFDYCVSGTTTSEEYLSTTELLKEIATEAVPRTTTTATTTPTTVRAVVTTTTKPVAVAATAKKPVTTTTTTRKVLVNGTTSPRIITKATNSPRPTIRFLTPQTTPMVVVRKLLPSQAPKEATTKRIFNIKPKYGKEVDVRAVTKSVAVTSQRPVGKDKYQDADLELEGGPFVGNFSEKDKFLSVKAAQGVGYNVALVVISVLGVLVLAGVIGVVVFRRCRFRQRMMASSNGDSQSDVRFLTSDEVLDFSLDKNYDSL